MTIQEVIHHIESLSPIAYAEDFDNVGLLVGNRNNAVTGILVTLDTLENVVDEAIEKKCNLIVSFHPIIFSGIKKFTGSTYVERVVMKAIAHNIAIYSMHTALDNAFQGVNGRICDELGLINRKILIPQKNTIKKLITFVPIESAATVRQALFNAGAGTIGNYNECSFSIEGIGTFNGGEHANPTIGRKGELHSEAEIQIGVIFPKHVQSQLLKALFNAHPYEEVAYEITTLENQNQHIGLGMIGELSEPMQEIDFLHMLKNKMQTPCIRHSAFTGKKIQKIAVLGGSGAFAIDAAKASGIEAFVTSDLKLSLIHI